MERVIIFGATSTGRMIYDEIKERYKVIAFVDQDDR